MSKYFEHTGALSTEMQYDTKFIFILQYNDKESIENLSPNSIRVWFFSASI